MKKIDAYKNRGALAMALVFGWQLLTGTGFFCVNQFPHAFRSTVSDRTSSAEAAVNPGDPSSRAWNGADSKAGTPPCTCKKKKKCPAIPRTTITSNPTHRSHEVHRLVTSACGDSLVLNVRDDHFAFGSAPPFLKQARSVPFSSSTPLSITCVLLI
jgi:hypothetical protein